MTEMPLAAFLEASDSRAARGENVSTYAVLVRKAQAFRAGARPVVYGLSDPSARARLRADGTRRFPASALPEHEQYRYVAFDPSAGGKLDWSHEREWRWPNRRYKPFESYEYDIPGEDAPEYEDWKTWNRARKEDRAPEDGLCLDSGYFDDIGFIVKTARQSKLLLHDILRLVDAGVVPSTLFGFILCLAALPQPQGLIEPADAANAIAAATVRLEPFFSIDANAAKLIRERFTHIVEATCRARRARRHDAGEVGGCWLWLMDNTHQLTRALLLAPEEEERRVAISSLGRYLVRLPELGDDRGRQLRKELTKRIANRVVAEFGTSATYYSVRGSDDFDALPFYTDTDDEIHVNEAHNPDDF